MTVFLSYARADADFALRLAADLRTARVDLWVDQLDIPKGAIWDQQVEIALKACSHVLVVLSPASVNSHNVMDEVYFALEEHKVVIPALFQSCDRPFRLRRLQYVDFTGDYQNGLSALTNALPRGPESRDSETATASPPPAEVPKERPQMSPGLTELEVGEERILRDTKRVLCVAFSPTGDMLASGGGEQGFFSSSDFAIRLWQLPRGKPIAEMSLHKAEVNYVTFSPDGGTLASSSAEAVGLWRMPDGRSLHSLEFKKNLFTAVAFSPDGSLLAAGAHLWRVSDGAILRSLPGGELFCTSGYYVGGPEFRGFAFSRDWAMIAGTSNDRGIHVLRVADGVSVLTTKTKNVWDLAFSPDGSMLASSWHDKGNNQVVILSIRDGKKRIIEAGIGGGRIAFSNDGMLLALGETSSGPVRVWRIGDGQLLAELPEKLSGNGIHSITFAPDDSWLAAGCEDKAIRLWPLRRH